MKPAKIRVVKSPVKRVGTPLGYGALLQGIKARVAQGQMRAVLSVNAELVRMYWDIGRMIDARQREEGWGAGVIPMLARELRNELPEEKGFSERNIGRMIAFFRSYPRPGEFLPQAVAKLPSISILPQPVAKLAAASSGSADAIVPQAVAKLVPATKVQQPVAQLGIPTDSILWSIPWGHHALLMEKVHDVSTRHWYIKETLAHGWSRNVLLLMVQSEAHRRQGGAITNFERSLPAPQSDLVRQALKDPYIFDFLTLEEPFHEKELEGALLLQMERFLLELGQGFAFVGRQYRIRVGERDYYIDLLFYHLHLRCFLVIDLKTGEFQPEHAGKMDFYLNYVDDKLRHGSDAPSIGLILCQKRDRVIAEYALRGMKNPIGISEYELTRQLPRQLRSSLPTIEQIEAELAGPAVVGCKARKQKGAVRRKVRGSRASSKKRKRR